MRAWLTGFDWRAHQQLIATVLILAVLWLTHRLSVAAVHRRIQDPRAQFRWRKSLTYTAVTLALLLVARVWFPGFSGLTTYLGLLSAGLAIALKDLVANLAGWIFILWRRPFEVGDRIQIGEHRGDVIDLRLFQFSLMEIGNWVDAEQSTGRMIHVPNGQVLDRPLANYSKGFRFIWEELPVLVTFESDWRAAKEVLAAIVQRHAAPFAQEAEAEMRAAARQYMLLYDASSPTVFTAVRDSGVLLTARYLVNPRQRRSVAQSVWEDLLDAFAARPEMDFAYPTTRFYDNVREGKSGPASGRPDSAAH